MVDRILQRAASDCRGARWSDSLMNGGISNKELTGLFAFGTAAGIVIDLIAYIL
jgi:hypothetical protein